MNRPHTMTEVIAELVNRFGNVGNSNQRENVEGKANGKAGVKAGLKNNTVNGLYNAHGGYSVRQTQKGS